MSARMVDENAAHRLGGEGKESASIRPVDLALCYQLEIYLVDERTRIERVAVSLHAQPMVRQALQLGLGLDPELIERLRIGTISGR